MDTKFWPTTIMGLGVLVSLSALWHILVFDRPTGGDFHAVVALVMIGGAGVGIILGGVHLRAGAEDGSRILALWMGGSLVLFVSVGIIVLDAGSEQVVPSELIETVHIAGSVGLVTGLLVGMIYVQSVRNARTAARAEAEAEALEAERERMEQLNEILRHHILNSIQIIAGYAGHHNGSTSTTERTPADIIEQRAHNIATLIQNVRFATGAFKRSPSLRSVDLEETIDVALDGLSPAPTIEIETPSDSPTVQANNLDKALELLFGALIDLIETDDTEAEGRLIIDIERDPSLVTVLITAMGIGTDRPRSSLFEPSGSMTDLQCYLSKSIIEQYGDLAVVDSDGQRLTLKLMLDARD